MSDINERVRQFISSELMFDSEPAHLNDETPLLGAIVDSLGLMQLISFLEEEFGVTIDDSEVTADNFRTVADIERLISRKAQVG